MTLLLKLWGRLVQFCDFDCDFIIVVASEQRGDPSVILEYIPASMQSCFFVFYSLTDPSEFNNVSSDVVVVEGDPSIYSVSQMVNQHQTSPGPKYLLRAVTALYWQLGISLSMKPTEITVEHIAVQHIME